MVLPVQLLSTNEVQPLRTKSVRNWNLIHTFGIQVHWGIFSKATFYSFWQLSFQPAELSIILCRASQLISVTAISGSAIMGFARDAGLKSDMRSQQTFEDFSRPLREESSFESISFTWETGTNKTHERFDVSSQGWGAQNVLCNRLGQKPRARRVCWQEQEKNLKIFFREGKDRDSNVFEINW